MDITVYLPDELGQWAKQAGLNLSQTLRGEVEAERRRRKALEETQGEATTHELDVEEPDGYGGTDSMKVRLHGTMIAEHPCTGAPPVRVYLGKDGKVYVHDISSELHRDVSPDDLAEFGLDEAEYVQAMRALGEDVVIDVGLPG